MIDDYRSRHPSPPVWFRDEYNPVKLDRWNIGRHSFHEFSCPQDGTTFVVIYGAIAEDLSVFYDYAVESPVDCPMRRSLEKGELSYIDFLDHRGWVLEIGKRKGKDNIETRYIHPQEMDRHTRSSYTRYGKQSLADRQHELLLLLLRFAYTEQEKKIAEANYQAFITLHGDRYLDDEYEAA